MNRVIALTAVLVLSSAQATAATVREFVVVPIALPDGGVPEAAVRSAATDSESAIVRAGREPSRFLVYPVAGQVGRDLAIPYFVDLDSSDARVDFECGRQTFNDHDGHDPYIRSFAEQEIGVPVFAVLDGVVEEVHDGEPDQNTANDPSLRSNYIRLRHNGDEVTEYVHLKRGIPVREGDVVTAGTQIGMVGSSGPSTGPHIHFESQLAGESFEPLAGPCRAGRSYFVDPPQRSSDPLLLGATLSTKSFSEVRPAPFDEASRTGTFVYGTQTIYFKADVANVGGSSTYRLLLEPPNSSRTQVASSGTLVSFDTSMAAIWWGLDVNLNRLGTWNLVLEISNRSSFTIPFTVVETSPQIVNRPPNPVSAEITPTGLYASQVAVCSAQSDTIPDPDFDVARYRFVWTVDGATVRDVTTAARSDALARQFVRSGAEISCAITVSDGRLSAQTATAHAAVRTPRTRAVRR